jgi:hypothetical protein
MQRLNMLHIECVDSAQLQLESDHSHVEIDSFDFSCLVVKLWFLEQLEDGFELLVCEFDVLAGFAGLLFGGVAAWDIVEQTELEVDVFLGCGLGDAATRRFVDFVGSVDLQQLVEHMV